MYFTQELPFSDFRMGLLLFIFTEIYFDHYFGKVKHYPSQMTMDMSTDLYLIYQILVVQVFSVR